MKLKVILPSVLLICMLLSGCQLQHKSADIAATTLPVYQFTQLLTQGTGLTCSRLVSESVSCLHDYSLHVRQVKLLESAHVIVLSGAGLEEFMADLLKGRNCIDASQGLTLLESCHEHGHEHTGEHAHSHEHDPHIWLSPENAMVMAQNICAGLCREFPKYKDAFTANLQSLWGQLEQLQSYGRQQLAELSCRELITFHDGFAYFAQAFDLTILHAMEEEAGSEVSAADLKQIITQVREHSIPAIFTETNGSGASASIIARETGVRLFALDMAMAGEDYFAAMYANIDTLKEALA
jgi:zinc transport system substrate-binding protein